MADDNYCKLTEGNIRRLTPDEKKQYPAYNYVVVSESRFEYDDKIIVVPIGFLTDGATGGPDYGCSWLFHDYLYATHKFTSGQDCTRIEADGVMERVLRHDRLYLYCWVVSKISQSNILYLFSSAWESSGRRGPEFLNLS